MNKIYVANSKDLGDGQWKINFINQHIYVVHKTAGYGLCAEDAKDNMVFSKRY